MARIALALTWGLALWTWSGCNPAAGGVTLSPGDVPPLGSRSGPAMAKETTTAINRTSCLVQPGEVVLILGDSITADSRYAQIMQNVFDRRWQRQGARRVVAQGNSGWTVRDHLATLDKHVVAWRPNWVLINLGTNDMGRFTVDEFIELYYTLITRIRRDTGARIGLIVPLYVDHPQPEKHKLFERAIKYLAEDQDCLLIPTQDLYNAVRDVPPKTVHFGGDAVHVNELGYQIYAAACLNALGEFHDADENHPKKPPTTEWSITVRATQVSAMDPKKIAANKNVKFTLPLPPGKMNVTVVPLERLHIKVPRTKTPITIDGNLDDWKDIPVTIELDNPKTQQVSGIIHNSRSSGSRPPPRHPRPWDPETVDRQYHWSPLPLTMTNAKARMAWDNEGLYVAVEVVTPALLRSKTTNVWDGDCIEFHLDLRQTEAGKPEPVQVYGEKNAGQVVIGPGPGNAGPAAVSAGSGDDRFAKTLEAAYCLTAAGYVIEFKLPASQFPTKTLAAKGRFRIDLTVSDIERSVELPDRLQLRLTGSPLSFFSSLEWAVVELEP
ncbi:MAG: GDSL-type esterase/lipase family protein [Phycisphaerae bacterium]|nr:GDSL-type esterase/lipase family protein [Phycisphaerae bacterium]